MLCIHRLLLAALGSLARAFFALFPCGFLGFFAYVVSGPEQNRTEMEQNRTEMEQNRNIQILSNKVLSGG